MFKPLARSTRSLCTMANVVASQPQHDPESVKEDVDVIHEHHHDGHIHYSHRAPWLRAFVLGANDGLVSTAALMLGVGGGSEVLSTMQLAGLAGLVGGALSMACGEYISVASQKDAEEADIAKERAEQAKGPEAQAREFEELVAIYMARGISATLARQVAKELTDNDVVRAHARDELGIDLDVLANPLQASVTSTFAFAMGASIPLLAGSFLADYRMRILSVVLASAAGLVLFGAAGSMMGGARPWIGALRVLVGGCLAMASTYAIGLAFGVTVG